MKLEKLYHDSRISVNQLPKGLWVYLPRSKSDNETVERLRALSKEEIKPLLPFLLSWVQDMNWPISSAMSGVLVSAEDYVVPEVEWVLSGKDDIWKANCIRCVLLDLRIDYIIHLLPILKRIAHRPTEGEKEEEADDDAKACIEYIEKEGANQAR
ncbi:DUF5071 domain-containing protein [Rubellicoccus peritrichatus]|uniref:DUF5071 domain-containing protein n=1 Tax=Rubellicoccus peritrichatus TaxID=3080537 RepID=A0AAQ3QQK2_9BACT|nr:DUF5071 domain-containing protein [Puniceicoccus sp. CR14]WOO40343.1 DUF5071 domain-containing protein [Puniceicoccus sp. CR14]